MRTYFSTLVLGGFIVPIAFALAQPYAYVATNGSVAVEVAHNPTEAILSAPQRVFSSGVMELSEAEAIALAPHDTDTEVYAYVQVDGELGFTTAENPMEAIIHAENRIHDSGVMLIVE